MDGVNLVIVIAGIIGLVVAGYGFVTLTLDAWRHRQYLDIALAAGLAIAIVVLLIAYGDRLLR
jgi:FtsH-binding integral membrane protein